MRLAKNYTYYLLMHEHINITEGPLQTCTAKTNINEYDLVDRDSCGRFQDMPEITISHESCDDTNCDSLKCQLHLMMKGAVTENCQQFIKVDDSCKREGCSRQDARHFYHPRQSVVAYISVAAEGMLYDECSDTHGPHMVVVGEANESINFEDGCMVARVNAIEKLEHLLTKEKGEKGEIRCNQFIVTNDCVLYDKHVQP